MFVVDDKIYSTKGFELSTLILTIRVEVVSMVAVYTLWAVL